MCAQQKINRKRAAVELTKKKKREEGRNVVGLGGGVESQKVTPSANLGSHSMN